MKFCPKCRGFYDDESLAICQKDGVPLIKLNQSSELWTEGTNAIETTQKAIRKQTRIQKLKRFAKILVTTVMMLMVVSVIAMNTYIYLPTKEVEKAENILPSPTVKRTETPTETPTIIEETPSPSPKATVQITPSPSPSDSPTPTPSPTATPSPTQTPIEPPPRSPTPTLTRTPNPCTDAMRQQEQIIIKNSNGSFWEASINMKKQSILDEYERKYQQPVAAELTVLSDEISITVNSDCKTANVSVPYFWTVFRQLPNGRKEPPIKIFTSRNFSCRKDSVWKCA